MGTLPLVTVKPRHPALARHHALTAEFARRSSCAHPPADGPCFNPAASSVQARRSTAEPNRTLFVAGFDPRSIRTRDIERAFEEFGRLVVSAWGAAPWLVW